ncbi:MAG: TM2 domain-containing protein [Ruminococcus sp.]|nr:TM2 domain-containing protein [Ruminococcus sp.]
MSEFYRPDRHERNTDDLRAQEVRKTESAEESTVTYDYPKENIRIVVDRDQPSIRTVDLTKPQKSGVYETREVYEADRIYDTSDRAQTVNNTYIYNDNRSYGGSAVNAHDGTLRNKYIALILCLFGGVIGLHRYYEGKIASGILYTCTGGLGTIGAIIDFLILLGKPKYYKP